MFGRGDKGEVSTEKTEFEEMFDTKLKEFKEGDIVTGRVVDIAGDTVMLDIGYKSDGVVPLREFLDNEGKPTVKVGDEVKVCVERREDENGFVVLSKVKADQMNVWENIIEACEQDKALEGTITQRIKGGFYVDIDGLTAFLPGSQVDLKPVRDPDAIIGKTFQFKILKYNRRKNNIIVSRRVILEKEREALRKVTLERLEEGAIMEGTVKNIINYGAFVDLGGIDGLVHVTDLSWGKVSHPSQILKVGDRIKVKVLRYDREEGKISLGLKQTKPDPWLTAAEKYPVGTRVKGRVVNITDYGAFVELEEGLEGLVHVSEMSWSKIRQPSQKVSIGEEVEVQVLNIDTDARRISLGMKQVEKNPWEGAEERYPRGTRIKGVVKNITDFGIFVGVEEGIDGLVHISDLSWKKVKHPAELFRKGQEVEAVVLNIDSAKRRFSLSTKLLEKNPWEGVEERYRPGTVVEGRVTSITDFGAFVEIEKGLEGLIHISEINRGKKKGEEINPGDLVEVEILNVDPGDNKIGLSLRTIKEIAPVKGEEISAPHTGEEAAEGAPSEGGPPLEAQAEESRQESPEEAAEEKPSGQVSEEEAAPVESTEEEAPEAPSDEAVTEAASEEAGEEEKPGEQAEGHASGGQEATEGAGVKEEND